MDFKRKLFYLLPYSLRFIVRRLYFLPSDIVKSLTNKELIPPQGLVYTGYGDFIKQGENHVRYFKDFAHLTPNESILDIGSGIGRTALGLTKYLSGEASYEGFDAVELGVTWCKKNITKRFPNFNFLYVPLYNDLYNKSALRADSFEFPYRESTFTFACAMSVYTHMVPSELIQYLKQTYKVLKPGGRSLATFFYYDDHTTQLLQEGKTDKEFNFDRGNYKLMDAKVTAANVAYQKDYLLSLIENAGFSIEKVVPGYWREFEKQTGNDYQDIIVFRKPG